MHLFLNALAASAGGGLTYIRNVLPQLAATPDLRATVAVNSTLRNEFSVGSGVDFLGLDVPPARRFWYEQATLPGLIRRSRADVLVSAGNFSIRRSPVPQILLSRNSIYISADYYRDLLLRHEYRMWLETRLRSILAKRSVYWADATVAPSQAFADELRRWTGVPIVAIHHGFGRESFACDSSPLSTEIQDKLVAAQGSIKLLFVSHYNYYRNFETLIRALPLLRSALKQRPVRLLLTCQLAAGKNPGAYHPEGAAALIRSLGVSDMVVELGAIPYPQLHRIYAAADVYVTPAYTETFAHPLLEAMSSEVPVIASDLAVHREICGPAALYFERFSPQDLAARVMQLVQSPEMRQSMIAAGLKRSSDFSWSAHVAQILALSQTLISAKGAPPTT